jgi:hypothetical protein
VTSRYAPIEDYCILGDLHYDSRFESEAFERTVNFWRGPLWPHAARLHRVALGLVVLLGAFAWGIYAWTPRWLVWIGVAILLIGLVLLYPTLRRLLERRIPWGVQRRAERGDEPDQGLGDPDEPRASAWVRAYRTDAGSPANSTLQA